ncbi:MAG: L-ectoine synthase [Acidimicrobiia bacterium]|nr:L-ectoine synthase [Acidimicrobiia bacterium]
MIVRSLESIIGTDRDVRSTTWTARRLLLARDGMGFSLHDTVIDAGTETAMWYKNHLEAVYCIEGEGTIEDTATGEVHDIRPGTMYALDLNDRHVVRARTQLRLVCAFNPPCTGAEVHDEDGAYPLLEEGGEPIGSTR